MKSNEEKLRFVEMRAEGLSFAAISKELGISKSTCSEWEKSFADDIRSLKADRLDALYTEFAMRKESRIRALGSTLNKINDAIDKADLTSIAPEKLLDMKLKFQDALKKEYHPVDADIPEKLDIKSLKVSLVGLASRLQSGDDPDRIRSEIVVINSMIKSLADLERKESSDRFDEQFGLDRLLGI